MQAHDAAQEPKRGFTRELHVLNRSRRAAVHGSIMWGEEALSSLATSKEELAQLDPSRREELTGVVRSQLFIEALNSKPDHRSIHECLEVLAALGFEAPRIGMNHEEVLQHHVVAYFLELQLPTAFAQAREFGQTQTRFRLSSKSKFWSGTIPMFRAKLAPIEDALVAAVRTNGYDFKVEHASPWPNDDALYLVVEVPKNLGAKASDASALIATITK